jgi:hypothetical protein
MTFNPRWGQAGFLEGDTLAPGIHISSLEVLGELQELHVNGPAAVGVQAPTVNVALRAEDVVTGANGTAVKIVAGGGVTVAANNDIVAGVLVNSSIAITAAAFTGVVYRGMWIRNPTVSSGTIAENYGLYIDAMTSGTTDYAIRTLGGLIRFTGLPVSAAGLAAGTLWNNAGVVNVV